MVKRLPTFLKNCLYKGAGADHVGSPTITMPSVSPYTKHVAMINQATSYNYLVPVQDNGNMSSAPR